MAGRKPKPTAVKKLEGNPGKRKLNTKEPNPGKGMPDCPAWLLPEAKTEWMLRSILVTDPLPCSTIPFLRSFISAVLLIVTVAQLLMLFTESFVCQLRASGIRAWMLRFPWHHSTFFPIEKAATVFCSATALSSFAFASLTLSHRLLLTT